MLKERIEIMKKRKGFIAALDQSGGSTPKALEAYGVHQNTYDDEEEMFEQVHKMRSRIIENDVFNKNRVLGVILFEDTMNRKISGKYTADYLWEDKNILPFLKVDEGLEEEKDGVQMMKEMKKLEPLLEQAKKRNIFGTKMRSVIKKADKDGIHQIVKQQFDIARVIAKKKLVPIIEPEVDINSEDKAQSEEILLDYLIEYTDAWDLDIPIIFKLSLPSEENLYYDLSQHPKVLKIVALSGGYTQKESNELLSKNNGLVASFSRALLEGLHVEQTEEEFERTLDQSLEAIYQASIQ